MKEKNILLVTVDSLRADHCGFINRESSLTPNLDEMASEGLVFENAIAPGPRTPSSMPVVFTGELNTPYTGGTQRWGPRKNHIARHLTRNITIAESLKNQGYTTVGFSLNPWTQYTSFEKGFDHFVQLFGNEETSIDNSHSDFMFKYFGKIMEITNMDQQISWENLQSWFLQWPQYYDLIQETMDSVEEPYFLWIFTLEPHQPYIPPKAYRVDNSSLQTYYAVFREYMSSDDSIPDHASELLYHSYRDCVRSADALISRLHSDFGDNAFTVVHSDHGEAFGDHGTYGHEQDLFEENIHVPLIIHGIETDGRTGNLFPLKNLPELITDLNGIECTSDVKKLSTDYVYSTIETGEKYSIRTERWKYINISQKQYLYDLKNDPDEQNNIYEENRRTANELNDIGEKRHRHLKEKNEIQRAVDLVPEL